MKPKKLSRGRTHKEEEFGFHSDSLRVYYAKMDVVGRPDGADAVMET